MWTQPFFVSQGPSEGPCWKKWLGLFCGLHVGQIDVEVASHFWATTWAEPTLLEKWLRWLEWTQYVSTGIDGHFKIDISYLCKTLLDQLQCICLVVDKLYPNEYVAVG